MSLGSEGCADFLCGLTDSHARIARDKPSENESSYSFRERIEVRGDSKTAPSPQPSPAKAGEGDVCHFYFENINCRLLSYLFKATLLFSPINRWKAVVLKIPPEGFVMG